MTIRKLVDDIVYEVDCAMITIKDGQVDIGGLPRFPPRKWRSAADLRL